MLLTQDISCTGFPLSIKGIEILFQTLFRRFSGINGARDNDLTHFFNPKNTGPDQGVPVMALAIAERLRHFLSAYKYPSSRTVT
jgi:hypothetical protein